MESENRMKRRRLNKSMFDFIMTFEDKVVNISTSDLNPEIHASHAEPENPCEAPNNIFKECVETMYLRFLIMRILNVIMHHYY